jgi:putative transposase
MKRIEHPNHARFITFSTYRKIPIFKTQALRYAFIEQLQRVRIQHEFSLFAWVLMPNHVHMLLMPGSISTTPIILRAIKIGSAKRILARWRELDAPILKQLVDAMGKQRLWQYGGGYDRNITSTSELHEKIRYIHANPVRAGLVSTPTDWPWSSAAWWSGDHDYTIRCDQPPP